MKKITAIIFAGLLACTAAFASPNYNGDLQVHTGVGFDEFYYAQNAFNSTANTVLFNLDVESWNLFEINDLFSFGFMVGTDFGWGGVTSFKNNHGYSTTNSEYCKDAFHWNIFAAPAVAFSFKPVKLQCSVGLDLAINPGYGFYEPFFKQYYSFPAAFGLVTEVQAKFFPAKKFSPIVGYRYIFTGSGRRKVYNRDTKHEESDNMDIGFFSSGVLYVGASFNW